ncbi:hypothetical protein [Adlercreutzia sp. ZJ141]|uniref:hypothetical protein n=1 Tax=Adlercreutzia sp. ZJ141 TaxID=2709406 RepID=UPI0013ED8EC9|nr:hypothetical protein [Adlercreutzia sp. ZJ141]
MPLRSAETAKGWRIRSVLYGDWSLSAKLGVVGIGAHSLDEAFDKADPAFARTAMDIFEVFGFHMVLATPFKLITVLKPYVGAVAHLG